MTPTTRPVVITMPHKKTTANYVRFEKPYMADSTEENGGVYITKSQHAALGYPDTVRVTVTNPEMDAP